MEARSAVAPVEGPGFGGVGDYDNVDFMVFIGINPVISHSYTISVPNPTGTVRAIAKRGQVWVIHPRRTETARLATAHLAPRPGTDHAVLACLVRELAQQNRSRRACARQRTLTSAVEPLTLARTAELADVAPDD